MHSLLYLSGGLVPKSDEEEELRLKFGKWKVLFSDIVE